MASLSSSELKKNIAEILKGADLSTLSSKKVRKMLEEKYEVDLTDRKSEIDEILMAMVTEENEKDGSDDSKKENSDEDSVKGSVGNSSESEVEKEPPRKKVKSEPKKILKKNSKNDSKKDSCSDRSDHSDVDDEALARKLQEEERNSRSRAVKKISVKKEKRKRIQKTEAEGGKPRKESTYTRKCELSADLANVVGAEEMARHDVVKRMWAIVKERDLFDPSNKQFAFCDDQLQKVFGIKRIRMFAMMKYLKSHIKDKK